MIGDIIKQERLHKGLTQDELAKAIEVSPSTVGMYEQNRRKPDGEIVVKLAEFFNVSTDYLLGHSNIRNPYKDDQSERSLPESLDTPEEAMEFILKQKSIMAFGGFDVGKLSDQEKIDFANELLEHLKLLSYKYKK